MFEASCQIPNRSVAEWLAYIETLHPQDIALGLDRVRNVAEKMGLLPAKATVISVAGTNGKGSVCAFLEAILLSAGWRVGLYTSPHFVCFNERIRIGGVPVEDVLLVEALKAVELNRGDTALTYFEFTTLAALQAYATAALDVVILEVGLGGRLDAVNIVDPDCAVLTAIGVDHTQYLGETRGEIGWEKAHIFRPGRPAICTDPDPPVQVQAHASAIGADFRQIGEDFRYTCLSKNQWSFYGKKTQRLALAYPAMRGSHQLQNAAGALATLEVLEDRLVVPQQAVRTGLGAATLTGRLQVLPGYPMVMLDVAHNPHAAVNLAKNLEELPGGYTYGIFGVMSDKDVPGIIKALQNHIDHWVVVPLPIARAMSVADLASHVQEAIGAVRISDLPDRTGCCHVPENKVSFDKLSGKRATLSLSESPKKALSAAQQCAHARDRIIVLGSFFTVAGVL